MKNIYRLYCLSWNKTSWAHTIAPTPHSQPPKTVLNISPFPPTRQWRHTLEACTAHPGWQSPPGWHDIFTRGIPINLHLQLILCGGYIDPNFSKILSFLLFIYCREKWHPRKHQISPVLLGKHFYQTKVFTQIHENLSFVARASKGFAHYETLEERSFIEIGSSHQKKCIFDKVVSPNKGQYNNCGPSCRPTWGNGLIATCTCLGLRDGHLGRKCFGCKGECLSGSRIDSTSKSKHVNNNVKLTISWLIYKLRFNC